MPIVTPNFKIRCPYCRKRFHPSDAPIVFLNATAATMQAPRPPRHGSLRYYTSRFWAEELNGENYTQAMARRMCPYCHHYLPSHDIDETLNIAIVGDTSAGKTHYIAILIDLLGRGLLTQAGNYSSRLVSVGLETDKRYRENYFIPILQEKDARLGGTQPGQFDASGQPIPSEPLVYQFSLRDNHAGIVKKMNLLLYDISGEDVADADKLVQFGEHILRADGIIYLADPVTMQHIRGKLPSYLQPDPALLSTRAPHAVLANVMHKFEEYQGIASNGSITTPVAITISKSDLLRRTLSVYDQSKYLIFQPKAYDGRVYPQEFTRIHQEIESLLRFYEEHALLQISNELKNMNFFAASATGNPPDGNGLFFALDPLRCLDPFIWILWKLGLVPAA